MKTATTNSGRIFRWSVSILGALVLLFLLASLVFCVLARSARLQWQHLASEIRADGQPLTYAEIEASRPRIEEEANGAVVIRQAARLLESVTEPDESGVLLLDPECEADFFEGIDRRCLPSTRAYVEARREALTTLSELPHYRSVRLNLAYGGTMLDFSSERLDAVSNCRALGKLLTAEAFLEIIDDDLPAAVNAIVVQLRMSQPLYDESDTLPRLVAIATDWLAVDAVEGLLAAHELDTDDLDRLQREWNRQVERQTIRPSLLGQRARFARMSDKNLVMADARAALGSSGAPPPKQRWRLPNPIDWIPFKDDWFLYENSFEGMKVLTQFLETSDDLSRLLDIAKREEASVPRFAPGRLLLRMMLPSLVRSFELHARTAARSRCVPVAMAAERFRLGNGFFPSTAAELVPDYLSELPRDPYDGDPIRLAKTEYGIVVYSIGENRIDDGGQVVPQANERLGRDFGVRLLNPDTRSVRLIGEPRPDDPG